MSVYFLNYICGTLLQTSEIINSYVTMCTRQNDMTQGLYFIAYWDCNHVCTNIPTSWKLKWDLPFSVLLLPYGRFFLRNSRFYKISGQGLILRTAEGRVAEQKQKVFWNLWTKWNNLKPCRSWRNEIFWIRITLMQYYAVSWNPTHYHTIQYNTRPSNTILCNAIP